MSQAMRIYSIHDKKASAFLPPFFLPTEGMAIRGFYDCINDPNHNFALHPGDYDLYTIGMWKPEKGIILAEEGPNPVITGLEVLGMVNKDKQVNKEEEEDA